MSSPDQSDQSSKALAAATERRVELKEAVSKLELAASSPIAMPSWHDYVLRELHALKRALDQHIDEVEGDTGLFAELTELEPRLAHKIERVRDEHPVLSKQTDETLVLVQGSTDNEGVRAAVLDLLFAVVRHRQHGADLVFDGYNVDIGGG